MTRKFGLKPTFIVCQLLAAVTFVGMYFATADSVMVLYVFYALNALPSGMLVILTGTMITNCVEYAEWKTGQRNEALICSTQTFVAKLTIAITTGLAGVVLSAVGYVPNAEQTPETIKAIHFLFTLFPAIAALFAVVPMFFYELTDKRYNQILSELQLRKAQATATLD